MERVIMPGDGWRDAHDFLANTIFGIAFDAGLRGSTETRGLFSQAVPMEVLAAQLEAEANRGGGRSTQPGAIPDGVLTVGGRRLIYDVKCIHFCPSRYWPSNRVADARGGPLEHRAQAVNREYRTAAAALDARTATHYRRAGQEIPAGAPTAVEILDSFPPVEGLVFGSTAAGGSRGVGILIERCAASAAQRHWRTLGTRSITEARAFMTSIMRRQISFAAAMAHARLRLSRLERIGHSGRIAGRIGGVTAPFLSQTVWEQFNGGMLGGGGGRSGGMGPGLNG